MTRDNERREIMEPMQRRILMISCPREIEGGYSYSPVLHGLSLGYYLRFTVSLLVQIKRYPRENEHNDKDNAYKVVSLSPCIGSVSWNSLSISNKCITNRL